MNSIILRTGASFLLPVLLVASVVILFRGHNEPGGGFVGGLVASTALLLYMLAYGVNAARSLLRLHPVSVLGAGLAVTLLSGLPALAIGKPVFAAIWTDFEPVPGVKVGTPLFFDIGVYLTVAGVVLLMIFAIAERDERESGADRGDR
jgi:multisubunit Na+/H+ antiporter MnhB subunit